MHSSLRRGPREVRCPGMSRKAVMSTLCHCLSGLGSSVMQKWRCTPSGHQTRCEGIGCAQTQHNTHSPIGAISATCTPCYKQRCMLGNELASCFPCGRSLVFVRLHQHLIVCLQTQIKLSGGWVGWWGWLSIHLKKRNTEVVLYSALVYIYHKIGTLTTNGNF